MIVSESFLEKARSTFDLNEYEIKTWVALLSRNESTAGELAEISTVPRSRVYDILESLTAKGFVEKKRGTPIKYKTTSPNGALAAAKKNAIRNASDAADGFEKLKENSTFRELEKLYKQGSAALLESVASVVKGRENINSLLRQMVTNSKKSITIATTRKGALRKAEKLGEELKRAKTRGVSVKLASTFSSMEDVPELLKNVADMKKHKGNDARFVIADGKSLLLMLNNDEEVHEAYDFGILVNSAFVAEGFEHFFENSWKEMNKL